MGTKGTGQVVAELKLFEEQVIRLVHEEQSGNYCVYDKEGNYGTEKTLEEGLGLFRDACAFAVGGAKKVVREEKEKGNFKRLAL